MFALLRLWVFRCTFYIFSLNVFLPPCTMSILVFICILLVAFFIWFFGPDELVPSVIFKFQFYAKISESASSAIVESHSCKHNQERGLVYEIGLALMRVHHHHLQFSLFSSPPAVVSSWFPVCLLSSGPAFRLFSSLSNEWAIIFGILNWVSSRHLVDELRIYPE